MAQKEIPRDIGYGFLQVALTSLGHDPGSIDGKLGKNTKAALLGLNTELNGGVPAIPSVSTPYNVMLSLRGTKENPSATASHPRLKEMFADTGFASYDDSKLPWCGVAMGYCHIKAGWPRPDLPKYIEVARDWLEFGESVEKPQRGDIAILWRGSRSGWKGHVAFFHGYGDNGKILLLGGNQSDSVSVVAYDPDRVLGYRRATKS
jgi:uncharacterized protein (TIGR02594 family)